MDAATFFTFVERYGFTLAVAVVMFLAMVIRERKLGLRLDDVAAEALAREMRMEISAKEDRKRFDDCRREVLEKSSVMIAQCTVALAQIAPAMERNTLAVDKNSKILADAERGILDHVRTAARLIEDASDNAAKKIEMAHRE